MLIREVENGLVSRALRKCSPGTPLHFMGPYGSFVIAEPADTKRQYLFVSTGTGIAPFHAFAQSYPGIRYTLLHGIRRLEEQYDHQDYAEGSYIACVTQEDGGGFRGRVTDYLRAHPVAPSTICYLCGNRAMLAEAFDILREQGVPGNNLFSEAFF
jgi:NAD(P)H-flavin reductase